MADDVDRKRYPWKLMVALSLIAIGAYCGVASLMNVIGVYSHPLGNAAVAAYGFALIWAVKRIRLDL